MLTVYLKELLDMVRDRRTLIVAVLLPTIIFPVLFGIIFAINIKSAKDAQETVLKYALIGSEYSADISRQLADNKKLQRVTGITDSDEIEARIKDERLHFAITIPEGFDPASGESQTISLVYSNADPTNKVKQRVEKSLEPVIDKAQQSLMVKMGISEDQFNTIDEPIALDVKDIAGARERIGQAAGGFLPYIIILVCMSGAIYAAIDMGAGEKERGTLESLLINPLPRSEIVIGKFLAITTASLAACLMAILSLALWLSFGVSMIDNATINKLVATINMGDLLLIFCLMLPVGGMFAALMLLISTYARNFKEAQSYMSPLSFVVIIPLMISMMPGSELSWGSALIPITNVSLAMKELIKGTLGLDLYFFILIYSAVLVGAMLVTTIKMFSREDVLFRS